MTMKNDLMNMEGEFRILNQELETKTLELLKRADDIVKNQEQALKDLVTPVASGRDKTKSRVKLVSSKTDTTTNNHFYSDSSDNNNSDGFESEKNVDSEEDMSDKNYKETRKSEKRMKNLIIQREKMKNKQFSEIMLKKCESMPSIKEYFNVIKRISDYEIENYNEDDESENDEVDNMMKILDNQKEFNRSITSLMKTKESIRNKEQIGDGKSETGVKKPLDRISLPYVDKNVASVLGAPRKFKSDILSKDEKVLEVNYGDLNNQRAGIKTSAEDVIGKALRSKIKMLQDELQKINENLKKKSAECDAVQKNNQSLVENKIKLLAQVNSMKNHSSKLEAKITGLAAKLQSKENECKVLSGEKENLSKTVKEAAQSTSAVEVRIARAREDINALREQLSAAKVIEKEVRESSKQQMEELSQNLAKAEKRGRNAMLAVRKQSQLVDNLRRQVELLSSSGEVKTIEGQLDSLLQWNL